VFIVKMAAAATAAVARRAACAEESRNRRETGRGGKTEVKVRRRGK